MLEDTKELLRELGWTLLQSGLLVFSPKFSAAERVAGERISAGKASPVTSVLTRGMTVAERWKQGSNAEYRLAGRAYLAVVKDRPRSGFPGLVRAGIEAHRIDFLTTTYGKGGLQFCTADTFTVDGILHHDRRRFGAIPMAFTEEIIKEGPFEFMYAEPTEEGKRSVPGLLFDIPVENATAH